MVSSAKPSELKHFAELTTPAAPLGKGLILWMALPPFLCEEGNAPPELIRSEEKRAGQQKVCDYLGGFLDSRGFFSDN